MERVITISVIIIMIISIILIDFSDLSVHTLRTKTSIASRKVLSLRDVVSQHLIPFPGGSRSVYLAFLKDGTHAQPATAVLRHVKQVNWRYGRKS